jgi:hypothetical protein
LVWATPRDGAWCLSVATSCDKVQVSWVALGDRCRVISLGRVFVLPSCGRALRADWTLGCFVLTSV